MEDQRPGFRFHPTDEELIHYLKNKVSSSLIPRASIIAEIDLYKLNPWELPEKAYFGDSEWFCFSSRERKYPNGARPNRTAASGYWKATGTDKPILSSHASQYLGRAPKGTKTNWMMYEYRLPNNSHVSVRLKGSMRLDDWVLCHIRHKGIITQLKKETGTNSSENACTSDLDGYEEAIAENSDHNFENYKYSCKNKGEVSDAEGQQDFQERITEGPISDGNFDCKENRNPSLKDALESIKRVLSLGALDEQVAEWPNKRSCSLTPSGCRGNSTIFEISSI
ncbi:hypothetical protein Pfo_012882 [Paulownia fortunei]|nr:hypothetical protein Pfo_012882 [Paulownia fortunei]